MIPPDMARKTAETEADPEDEAEFDDTEELVAEPADLEEIEDPDEVVDLDVDDAEDDAVLDVVDDEDDEGETVPAVAEVVEEEEEEEDDEGDVEASLDVILKERLVQVDEEEEDEDEPNDPEDRAAPDAVKVLPKQPKEFVCQSCFLVKHPSQMADSKRQLCRDCV